MRGFLSGILDAWGAFLARRRFWVLGGVGLLALAALPVAFMVLRHLDVDILNQVSDRLPRFRAFRQTSSDFGGDLFAAVIWIPDRLGMEPEALAELKEFGGLLAEELGKAGTAPGDFLGAEGALAGLNGQPWLRQVECRFAQHLKEELSRMAMEHPHLVLKIQDVRRLGATFEPGALRERMTRVRCELEGYDPVSPERHRLLADPLGLSQLGEAALGERMDEARMGMKLAGHQGYFLSPDGTTLLVLARPARSAQNLNFNRALFEAVWRAENRALDRFPAKRSSARLTTAKKTTSFQTYPPGTEPSLRVGYTGLHAVAAENEAGLRSDIIVNALTAGLFVLAIYLLVYWRLRLAFHVILVLGLAVLFTLALGWPLHGPIGVLGVGFTSILIGMGEDYAVYLYHTFQGFRMEGHGEEPAIRRTLVHCGPGIMGAAVTAAAAFFGLSLAHFRAIAELGFLAGLGLTLSAIFMLSVFPALMLGRKGPPEKAEAIRPVKEAMQRLGRFQAWGPGRLLCLLGGGLAAAVAGGLIAWGPEAGSEGLLGVRFDGELGNLRSLRIQAVPLRQRIAERFGQGLQDIKVLVEAKDEGLAYAAASRVRKALRPLLDKGELSSSGSLGTWVPEPSAQEDVLAGLRALEVSSFAGRFLAAAKAEFGEKAERAFAPFLEQLRDLTGKVAKAKPLFLADLRQGPLAVLVELYARVDGEGVDRRVRLVLGFMPTEVAYPADWYARLAALAEEPAMDGVSIKVTGPRMVGLELRGFLFRDMAWITALVGATVLVVVSAIFRSIFRVFLTLLPVTFGYLAVLAGVQTAQIAGWDFSLNYVNLIIFPLLLGTGIDYGIYLVSDAFSSPRPSISKLVSHTGLSILIACLTTLAGFGSMVFSNFTGLISFGWAALLGYGGSLFGALVVLPALLSYRSSRPSGPG